MGDERKRIALWVFQATARALRNVFQKVKNKNKKFKL